MTTPDYTPQVPNQPPAQDMPPVGSLPPMPDQAPLQPFDLKVEVSGYARGNPEVLRRLIGDRVVQLVMSLQEELDFRATNFGVNHGFTDSAPQTQPAQGEAAPADAAAGTSTEESAEAPEPSLFTAETQSRFDTPITETFLSDEAVADINGEEPTEVGDPNAPEDESDTSARPTVINAYEATRDLAAEKLGLDKLVPLSDERRAAFAEALKDEGITTVRHAVILGLDKVRESVEYLRPKVKGRRRFDGEVATLLQGIVDEISDDAYAVLEKRPHDETKNERPVDTPLSLEEIAKFCNDPGQIPAPAVKTAAVQNFGHFPEFWNKLKLAHLINPANHNGLIQRARDVRPDQAKECLGQAAQFAQQLARLTQNQR